MRFLVLCGAVLLVSPAWAQPNISIDGKLEQGGLIVGTAPVGSTVTYNGHTIPTTYVGRFVVGFGRDVKGPETITIKLPDGTTDVRKLEIKPRTWQVEKVGGLPKKLVKPDRKTEAKIAADNKIMDAVSTRTESVPFFETGFMMPVEGKVTGVYGSQRILNGEPRSPHAGIDLAGPVGTPVHAAADGIVSLAKADMVLTGQTVVLEHGFGLDSIYIHMSAIKVKEGQVVRQGDVIGEIGKTGRANAPHLHFGITWFDTRIDPAAVLAVLPAKAKTVSN